MMTNRQGAFLLLVLIAPVVIYVLTSSWAFRPMRDGVLIGAFTMTYLALCIAFIVAMAFGPGAQETLDDVSQVNPVGIARIAAFIIGAIGLTFWHETYGFVILATAFLSVVSWFAGQREPIRILVYSAAVASALYLVFVSLGFDLLIAPGLKIGA